MDSSRAGRIGIVPVGEVPSLVPKIIAAHVAGYLNLEAQVLPPITLPVEALDRRRMQYDAGKILTALAARPLSGHRKLVGVVAVDIGLPIFTHVLGEAQQGGTWAVVSLFRLQAGHDGPPAVESATAYERAAKIALHEIGHLFNLAHCDDTRCLMHFSGGLADLDRLPIDYCRYCRTFFAEALNADGRRPAPTGERC